MDKESGMKQRQPVRESESLASWHGRNASPRNQRLDQAARSGNSTMMNQSTIATTITLMATLGLIIACWVFSVREMNGMNEGVATQLGTFAFFITVWIAMMTAMMLPGAIPAITRRRHVSDLVLAAPVFAATYIAVWAVVGVAVYALYQPHGTVAAGVITIAAGVYELTPIKRHFRERCRECIRSGMVFGFDCVGSSIGLMAMLIVLGVMNVTWMAAVAVVVVAQKLLTAKIIIDIPLALAIIGLGIVILAAPSSVPGLVHITGHMPMM
jgi:predicted metal-binding membrane protein